MAALSPSASKGPTRNETTGQTRPLVVIGNPENRRVTMFSQAAHQLGWPAPRVISYEQLLTANASLGDRVPSGAIVRIESPGENASVSASLIQRGIALHTDVPHLGDEVAAAHEHGRVLRADLWYAGYRDLLEQIDRELMPLDVQWMNHPADIASMFDKSACQERLRAAGIPTPIPISTIEGQRPRSYDDLKELLRSANARRVFVKPRHGSSASGVVALELGKSRVQATTSIELVLSAGSPKLFNSLRIRRYVREPEIATILTELCRQTLHVEHWVPKASLDGRVFDIRVLVIAGQVRHSVIRSSFGPLTNLHLGNQRGDLARLCALWKPHDQSLAWQFCERTAAAFSRSLYCGLDLVLTPTLRRHAILEVNAFGDLLPGIVHQNEDTYSSELQAAFRRQISASPDIPIHSMRYECG